MYLIAITENDKIVGFVDGENDVKTAAKVRVSRYQTVRQALGPMLTRRNETRPFMNIDPRYGLRIVKESELTA